MKTCSRPTWAAAAAMMHIAMPLRFALGVVVAVTLWTSGISADTRAVAASGMFGAERYSLDNGLEIVVLPNHRAPIVVHMVWYRVGAADDPVGKSGLAHFLEHLMFKGTPRYPDGEFSEIVARNGGRENAFTSSDYTGYFQRISKDRLALVMELEADRMRNLVLVEETVLPERDVVLEERSSRTDNNPGALLGERLNATLYARHPYGTPIIGWRHEIEQLPLDDAITFYDRHYAPDNAILVVAGDVTGPEVLALAEEYYGAIAPRDVPARVRPQEPPPIAPRRVTYVDPQVSEPSISRHFLAPSYVAGESQHAVPLQVLAELLGGKSTSRLYRDLVVEQGIAGWAGASYRPMALDRTSFAVYLSVKPGGDVAAAEAALDRAIDDLLTNGVTEKEVKAARDRMSASVFYALDSPSGIANIFGNAMVIGMDTVDVETWAERVAAVTVEDVMAAAQYVLQPARSVTGHLLPSGSEQ